MFLSVVYKWGSSKMADSDFDLADVIECLRQQLRDSRIRGLTETPRFLVDEAEVELKVGVSDQGKAGLSLKVFGVGIGADASVVSEAVQTIKLKLRPMDPNGREWVTAGTVPVPSSDDHV
ncbi:MAG: trypco2 family protein [Planctomycetota bacterium]